VTQPSLAHFRHRISPVGVVAFLDAFDAATRVRDERLRERGHSRIHLVLRGREVGVACEQLQFVHRYAVVGQS
jgi:hypothetical protein